MKEFDIEEYVRECGLFEVCGGLYIDAGLTEGSNVVIGECLIKFAKLVEQATLERAAKVCDAESFDSFERESRTRFAGDNETAYEHSIEKLAYAHVAKKIRALKDSHE